MRVIHIVGYSNVGKTRLIEALCARLSGGVMVLKFSHHLGSDRPGSDTSRFAARQADTLLLQPDQMTWRGSVPLAIDWARMAHYYGWMIWEGGKYLPTPKIVLDSQAILDQVSNVRLVIGPNRTQTPGLDYYGAELPLGIDVSQDIAAYILNHQQLLSFCWKDPSALDFFQKSS
ncbi:MAG: molybdopterin-guanine dinucleotide biosynthesis protein MobB [Firmicutes bacterium]|jgi:molybdopterin-guanine dinucleotide biosynthesis protein MobB|uniref:Molybdopterin-guanine dinucleotide biosynthesis protein B (MobB) domain-containing protein n=1 Tax=Sulfobacillus benefaciens TaxID=453960 RepID=A0A2T2X7Y1_9FIRM|nr:molybdopterin-guanine dinucleotide biosynthesis protein MobB [Bacillota bacterium]MCL5014110.1 molybdopterin-guanine dinucleotide biosynthesis protein MobB [Bacillota bacterium]PSR30585.1 MAG: hypothetical protein C7B43_05770 [Sulfobacillus benefaciens]